MHSADEAMVEDNELQRKSWNQPRSKRKRTFFLEHNRQYEGGERLNYDSMIIVDDW